MIVSIHQPNVFPWLGFFDKMQKSDLFILLDTVPFTKGGFQNRVQLKGPNGPQWLTVPVATSGRLGQATNDVRLDERSMWRKTHLGTFAALYGRREETQSSVWGAIERCYSSSVSSLTEFTIPGILAMKELLGIKTEVVLASELKVTGSSSQLLCDLVAEVGGDMYLSGPSGRNYLDESLFERVGIQVSYHRYIPEEYPQRFGPFVSGLSTLDYLLNGGASWEAANEALVSESVRPSTR